MKKTFAQWDTDLGPYEFYEFTRVENPRSRRADMHALLLLDELFPGDNDMIARAAPGVVLLNIPEKAEVSENHAKELSWCGVTCYDGKLAIFAVEKKDYDQ